MSSEELLNRIARSIESQTLARDKLLIDKYKLLEEGSDKDHKLFIFTFASKHAFGGKYQVIMARDYYAARDVMIEHYGIQWGFQYSLEEWGFQYSLEEWDCITNDPDRYWDLETPLANIIYEEAEADE